MFPEIKIDNFPYKEPLSTQVTKINEAYHCRLLENGKMYNEMACKEKQDISFCIAHMLRWYDKCGTLSKMASASRKRIHKKPIGKIWYFSQLYKLKKGK